VKLSLSTALDVAKSIQADDSPNSRSDCNRAAKPGDSNSTGDKTPDWERRSPAKIATGRPK